MAALKLFVAGSSGQRPEIRQLIRDLQADGHHAYDWTSHPAWNDPSVYRPREVADEDLRAVRHAPHGLIWVLHRGHLSEGAAFEAGYAHGLGLSVCCLDLGGLTKDRMYCHRFPVFTDIFECVEFHAWELCFRHEPSS